MNNLTQDQVSELSDFEVNKGIAEFLDIYMSDNGFGTVRVWASGVPNSIKGVVKDYCDNWNDLMFTIEELNLDFSSHQNMIGWRVVLSYSYGEAWESSAKNRRRAASECLFLVLQEKVK